MRTVHEGEICLMGVQRRVCSQRPDSAREVCRQEGHRYRDSDSADRKRRRQSSPGQVHRSGELMTTAALKRTPLYDVHRASGAKMVDFGGWDMPVQYSGLVDEHNTVRQAVGLFDVSHMGEIEIRGSEAMRVVDSVTTNSVARLKNGQAQCSGLLYEHGGFVDDILVHKVADDSFFLCVNASNQEKDFAHIQAANRFDCEVEYASAKYAQLALQGPI